METDRCWLGAIRAPAALMTMINVVTDGTAGCFPTTFAGYHLNGKRQISFTHAEILFERDWRAHHCQRSSAAINQHRWHAGGKKHARS